MDISYVNSRRVSVSREQTTLRRIKELKSSILDEKKVSARRSFSALYSVKKVLTRPIVSLSTKLPEKRISSATIGKSKRLKGVSRPKDHCGVGKVESERPSNVGVSKKYSSTIESERPSNEGVSKKYSSTIGSKGPSNEGTIESNVENKIVRPTQNSDSSKSPSLFPGHKSLKHAAKGISPIQSSPLAAEKILRRTRYGTHVNQSPKPSENVSLRRTKQGTHIIRSSASSLASPETIHGSKLSEPNQIDVENRAANAKVEFNTTPKKDRVVSTKEEARKLSFRTVKLLELQPGISSPRRLKFKRRFHSDSQIDLIETPKRSPKKTVLTDDVEAIVENSEREKVVLKHQDVEEKTEQSLLNNVIEETATKLAETRKSKVKALVGAFESVISLQDARPTVTVDAF
ncbi:hypothetical protein JCGZ_11682 [Jatropha curcas]|uniref:Calmodulin-binding domain-containing protein n=2 Tax=Jatropha curcas TaxID=180498 RepID=A0A067K514_JATCU|nr:hypothetical protein JCGZ_11682 [Jatropha curcas]